MCVIDTFDSIQAKTTFRLFLLFRFQKRCKPRIQDIQDTHIAYHRHAETRRMMVEFAHWIKRQLRRLSHFFLVDET